MDLICSIGSIKLAFLIPTYSAVAGVKNCENAMYLRNGEEAKRGFESEVCIWLVAFLMYA